MKKQERKEMLMVVRKVIEGSEVAVEGQSIEGLVEFIDNEVANLSKKRVSKKDLERMAVNDRIKEVLIDTLDDVDDAMGIKEIQAAANLMEYTYQKVGAVLNLMVEEGTLSKSFDNKHKPLFIIEKPKMEN